MIVLRVDACSRLYLVHRVCPTSKEMGHPLPLVIGDSDFVIR